MVWSEVWTQDADWCKELKKNFVLNKKVLKASSDDYKEARGKHTDEPDLE